MCKGEGGARRGTTEDEGETNGRRSEEAWREKGEGWVMEEMKCGRKGCKVNIKRKTTVFISAASLYGHIYNHDGIAFAHGRWRMSIHTGGGRINAFLSITDTYI